MAQVEEISYSDIDSQLGPFLNGMPLSRCFSMLWRNFRLDKYIKQVANLRGPCHTITTNGIKKRVYFLDEYEVGPIVGVGGFGIVRRCVHRATGQVFAVKLQARSNESSNELKLLKKLKHEHILRVHEQFTNKHDKYIVMDLMTGGSLESRLQGGRLSEHMARQVTGQVVSALAYMHDVGIAHRDIKPENILFVDPSPDSSVKIIDLGLASLRGPRGFSGWCLTLGYASPEMIDVAISGKPKFYRESCDMFSFGVVLYKMLTGDNLMIKKGESQRSPNLKTLRSRTKMTYISRKFNTPVFRALSLPAREVIKSLLQENPRRRMTARGVLNSDWLKGDDGAHVNGLDNDPVPAHDDVREPRAKRARVC